MKGATPGLGVALLAAAGLLPGAALARPAFAHHAAQLCVATLPKPPSCGPVQVDLLADGSMRMRFDDVSYYMKLDGGQVEIVVMHNLVQIDELVAPYQWIGNTLHFDDTDRHSRYEVRFPDARPAVR
jgi:hypothetical protein